MYLDRLTFGRNLCASSLDKKYICISTFDRIILLLTIGVNHDNGIKIMHLFSKRIYCRRKEKRMAEYLVKLASNSRVEINEVNRYRKINTIRAKV